ncbi:MAG: HpcH/HpaI aldolase/citrate lyase family protein, partial [Betaproteobacteria bacterium]
MSSKAAAPSVGLGARAALFVPATRADRIPKALASGADAVIVDLEDAVAPQDKDSARAALDVALAGELRASASAGAAGPALWVRVNAGAPWSDQDLALCARHAGLQAVVVPKAESAQQMQAAFEACGRKPLVALIETAEGYARRDEVASHPAVKRLAFGSIDFQLDLGISGEGDALLVFRSGLVLASRLAGLPAPLDGVTVDVANPEVVAADAAHDRALGFGGKLCIHPQQVGPVNAAFSPSPAEIAWAQRVVAACEASAGAAVA